MSSVWLCIPSARSPEHAEPVLRAWRRRGYKIAVWRDDSSLPLSSVDYIRCPDTYPGYAVATNLLISDVLARNPEADWCVIGGDDVWPDPDHSAQEIARECSLHFWEAGCKRGEQRACEHQMDTWGVMQPTGDRWGENDAWAQSLPPNRRAYIDRVCGSAWLGRQFCQRVNGGRGPLWPEYFHMYVDEELQCVAEKLGVLWQRPDLTQRHEHWIRAGDVNAKPDFHKDPRKQMDHGARIFNRRKAAAFPGYGSNKPEGFHEPLAAGRPTDDLDRIDALLAESSEENPIVHDSRYDGGRSDYPGGVYDPKATD